MTDYRIILPQSKYVLSDAHKRMYSHSQCLHYLNSKNIIVTEEHIETPQKAIGISDNNGKYGCFFSVNKNLFMILDTDYPNKRIENWAKHYHDRGVKALFICAYYKELKNIFNKLNIPAFPYFGAANLNAQFIDDDELTKKLPDCNIIKDIPIFFRGKFKVNVQRHALSEQVKKHFPNSYVEDSSDRIIPMDVYFKLLQRSKIVWSPPSAVFHDHYSMCIRERECMCVESLLIRNPIGILTPEEIIPGKHFVEVKSDNSNLIETLEKYLSDETERLRIAKNGRLFFEKNCTSIARANYLFEKCISVINS